MTNPRFDPQWREDKTLPGELNEDLREYMSAPKYLKWVDRNTNILIVIFTFIISTAIYCGYILY
jgi:hypothetical protein